jgi:hypothetical protein
MRPALLAPLLALIACSPSEPVPVQAAVQPDQAIVFTANDANRFHLKARIDEDPDQAVLLLEQIVAGSLASLTDGQFEEFRVTLIELLDEGRLKRLVRAGRERPATVPEVAQLIEDLDAWDQARLGPVGPGVRVTGIRRQQGVAGLSQRTPPPTHHAHRHAP